MSACIPADPDISGIGVRVAIYVQNLLSFIPVIGVLRDKEVSVNELESVESQSTTILITAFAILTSAMVETQTTGLSVFHANIILNLSWMNNTNTFIYFLLYIHYRSQRGPTHIKLDGNSWVNHIEEDLVSLSFRHKSQHWLGIPPTVQQFPLILIGRGKTGRPEIVSAVAVPQYCPHLGITSPFHDGGPGALALDPSPIICAFILRIGLDCHPGSRCSSWVAHIAGIVPCDVFHLSRSWIQLDFSGGSVPTDIYCSSSHTSISPQHFDNSPLSAEHPPDCHWHGLPLGRECHIHRQYRTYSCS
jgi:hypothetical protein